MKRIGLKIVALILYSIILMTMLTACVNSNSSGIDQKEYDRLIEENRLMREQIGESTNPPTRNSEGNSQAAPRNSEAAPGYSEAAPRYSEAVPFIYDSVGPFSEGLAAVQSGGRWGFIDKDGNEVIRCLLPYSYIYPFSDGMARFKEGEDRFGFIDRTGNVVISSHNRGYGSIVKDFAEGLAAVREDGKYGYIDKAGDVAIPFIYDSAESFSNGLASVVLRSSFGEHGGYRLEHLLIDKAMNEVVNFTIEYKTPFGGSDPTRARSRLTPPNSNADVMITAYYYFDGKNRYIDRTGREAISDIVTDDPFRDGKAPFARSGAYGFIDTTGYEIVPSRYVWVEYFSEGLAMVVYGGKVGFIDEAGNEVIPLIYDDRPTRTNYQDSFSSFFSEGLAIVELDGKAGFIDKKGNVVVPFGEYELNTSISYVSEGLAAVRENGKWGFIKIN